MSIALQDRYRIERELGQGGMATVYLAEDLKHHRRVALKVLRPELAAILGAERFLHEIRTTANLQHPHILPLHDSGQVEATVFYVMPYVDGETLRDRLSREKQLPVEDAVRIASQVAGALDYAHRQGVIHRDIKPENILLHDGSALVADFGIALAASSTGGGRMTETGMSLGTPHYMSPEQAMGEREITGRSDVYALGVVTYEMLTGDPPFTGSSAQAIVARVMTEEPRPLTLQRKSIPPHVEAAVLTAVEKLPADRWASAKEFADALGGDGTTTRRHAGRSVAGRVAEPPSRRAVLYTALALSTALALWGWMRPAGPAAEGSGVIVTDIILPDSAPLAFIGAAPLAIGRTALALSPDGTTLAYVAERGGGTQLYLRPLDRDTLLPVPGTVGACCPFFSPDGKWLAFHAQDRLSKVRPGLAGAPIPITTVNGFMGADWADDGWILVSEQQGRRATRVNPETGAREPLRTMYSLARAFPGGRGILARDPATLAPAIYVSGERQPRLLAVPGTDLRYAPTGHLTYAHQGALWVVPFDLSRLTVTGDPLALLPHVRSEASAGFAQYTFARNGLLAYAAGGNGALSRLVVRHRSGEVDTLPYEPALFGCLSLSPDGRSIVTRIADPVTGQLDLWVYALAGGTPLRLTTSGGAYCPSWSPDGRVTHVIRSGEESRILSQGATGRESPVTVATVRLAVGSSAIRWSPDGRRVAVYAIRDSNNVDILVVPLDSTGTVHPVAETSALEWGGVFSPDGRWIAYSSSESGADEIYVQPWPTTGQRWRLSRNGGEEPLWTRGGRGLVYRNGQEWWTVTVTPGATFTASEPERIARGPFLNIPGYEYAVSADEERLYLLAPLTARASTTRITLISDWFTLLKDLSQRARE